MGGGGYKPRRGGGYKHRRRGGGGTNLDLDLVEYLDQKCIPPLSRFVPPPHFWYRYWGGGYKPRGEGGGYTFGLVKSAII